MNNTTKEYSSFAALLRFARLHDWGYDAEIMPDGTGVRVGIDAHYLHSNEWRREYYVVQTMTELRNLAGY